LKIKPGQLAFLTKLIELNITEKNWDNANKYIDVISQRKNGVFFTSHFKSKILKKQNKCEKAMVLYKTMLDDYPWHKYALSGLAECYYELKKQSELKEYLDDFIMQNPDITYAYILKSQLMSRFDKYTKAIDFINNSLENKKIEGVSVYVELARLYAISGDKDAEYNTYINGLKNNSKDIGLLLLLAEYYGKNEQFNEAIEVYEKVLLLNPRENVAINNLATILLDDLGEVDDINKAIQLSEVFKQSRSPYFLDTYGWAQLKNGNIDKALSIFKKVIILQSEVPVFHYHLAVAYYKAGNTIAASSELSQALHLGKGLEFPEKHLIEELFAKIKN